MTVKDCILEYCDNNGYDGLFYNGECCCTPEDILPCGNLHDDCEFGYKKSCKYCPDKDKDECEYESSNDPDGFCIGIFDEVK